MKKPNLNGWVNRWEVKLLNKKKEFVFWGLAGVFVVLMGLFMYGREYFHFDEVVDTEVLGHFGDLVGGLGGFLGIFLLYKTLKLQNETLQAQRTADSEQTLHDRFYRIFDIYQNLINTVSVRVKSGLPDNYFLVKTGKEAIRCKVDDFLVRHPLAYPPDNPERGFRLATYAFTDLYAAERDFLPMYFRTIFRIFTLLDGEMKERPQEDPVHRQAHEYLKVFRAQLDETELLLLRYNAHVGVGQNCLPYIRKYNVLKHLPPLNFFEMRQLRADYSQEEQDDIDSVLSDLKGYMVDFLKGKGGKAQTVSSVPLRCYIHVWMAADKKSLILALMRKDKSSERPYDRLNVFNKMNDGRVFTLFKYLLFESFLWTVSEKPADFRRLRIKSKNDGDRFEVTASNGNGSPLL